MAAELVTRKGAFVGVRGVAMQVTSRTVARGRGAAFLEVSFRIAGYDVISRVVGDFMSVAEGDEMIVAGYIQGDVFVPVAWWNCTQERGYSPSSWGYRPTMIALTVLASLALWLVLVKRATPIQVLVLILPALILAGVAYSDYNRRRCAEWVIRTRHGQSTD